MNTKTVITTLIAVFTSVSVVTGIAYAASIDATSKLGAETGDDFEFDGTGRFNSIYIGKQGDGGVTFFNGTIVNNTTTDGVDNPVTISDNVRIDGALQRGHNKSTDQWPLKIGDDLLVQGDSELEGSLTVNGTNILDAINNKADSTDVYTQAESDAEYVSQTNMTFNTQTSYLSIPGTAFQPEDTATVGDVTYSGTVQPSAIGEMYAPISLPHSATITEMRLQGLDSDASSSIRLRLIKSEPPSLLSQATIAEVTTTDQTTVEIGTWTDTSISDSTVDNDNAYYFLNATWSGNANPSIANVIIEYTFTQLY